MRLKSPAEVYQAAKVSIHAPLRGATEIPLAEFEFWPVSIHAPLRGATHADCTISVGNGSFNPRTPAGCDCNSCLPHTKNGKFQSTHPCGVRHVTTEEVQTMAAVSIHAPLRGATIMLLITILTQRCFNPRTPAGCDILSTPMRLVSEEVSIHAPLRGATQCPRPYHHRGRVSIHAPLRGATSG